MREIIETLPELFGYYLPGVAFLKAYFFVRSGTGGKECEPVYCVMVSFVIQCGLALLPGVPAYLLVGIGVVLGATLGCAVGMVINAPWLGRTLLRTIGTTPNTNLLDDLCADKGMKTWTVTTKSGDIYYGQMLLRENDESGNIALWDCWLTTTKGSIVKMLTAEGEPMVIVVPKREISSIAIAYDKNAKLFGSAYKEKDDMFCRCAKQQEIVIPKRDENGNAVFPVGFDEDWGEYGDTN